MTPRRRTHIEAILSASSVERIFAWYEDEAVMKMRGLCVDANPVYADGTPLTPSDVDPVAAREMLTRPRRLRRGCGRGQRRMMRPWRRRVRSN
jgi:hypothetical protein